MRTIFSIAADRSFRATALLSCFGLGATFGLMAFGIDVNSVWL